MELSATLTASLPPCPRSFLTSTAMEFIRCWLLHRSTWTILIPGILPANIDAVAYCPTCDAGRGHRQVQLVPFTTRT